MTTVSDEEMQRRIKKAAKLIFDADQLLIAAGAGMGVDSGLPDFRGKEGFWKGECNASILRPVVFRVVFVLFALITNQQLILQWRSWVWSLRKCRHRRGSGKTRRLRTVSGSIGSTSTQRRKSTKVTTF